MFGIFEAPVEASRDLRRQCEQSAENLMRTAGVLVVKSMSAILESEMSYATNGGPFCIWMRGWNA